MTKREKKDQNRDLRDNHAKPGSKKRKKRKMTSCGPNSKAAKTNLLFLVTGLPWGHNVLLMEKIKNPQMREWYMTQCLQHGWSRDILDIHIENCSYERGGKATTNFDRTLPLIHSDMAQQTLKDPYIFDFLTIVTEFRERELECELIKHLQEFLIELGACCCSHFARPESFLPSNQYLK